MDKNYDQYYTGLSNLTIRQIESLAYRTGLKVTIKQHPDRYYLMLGQGVATSQIKIGVYEKNPYYDNIYED